MSHKNKSASLSIIVKGWRHHNGQEYEYPSKNIHAFKVSLKSKSKLVERVIIFIQFFNTLMRASSSRVILLRTSTFKLNVIILEDFVKFHFILLAFLFDQFFYFSHTLFPVGTAATETATNAAPDCRKHFINRCIHQWVVLCNDRLCFHNLNIIV